MLLDLALSLLALPVLGLALYLFVLAVLSAQPRPPPGPPPRLKFDVVVPAHDEKAGIAQTVQNLLSLEYPTQLRRVIVVADNCTDDTAFLAGEAGAAVWVRNDLERRGKGHALEMAFERSRADGFADAVVVVDADTVASPNLLTAFAARLENGAGAAQAKNAVLNPFGSWRTRLLTIAFALFNGVRSNARERLGLSCGLRGNGMCLSRETIRRVPHQAFSIVEDLEYGIRLGEAGIRVHYAPEAQVRSEMVSSEKAARSQRLRWEGGRFQLARRHALKLLKKAFAERSLLLFDLAVDLLVPPLSYLALASILGNAAVALLSTQAALPVSQGLWGLSLVFLAFYVLRGWWTSGVGWIGLLDLIRAPFYIVWKLFLILQRKPKAHSEWVRTARINEAPTQVHSSNQEQASLDARR